MEYTVSLKLNNDFRRLYKKGKNYAGGYVVIYALKNRFQYNRLGLTVSKKFGKAVARNRARRLMRESYRVIEKKLPKGYDFVIVARGRAAGKDFEHIRKDMEYALLKLELIR